ncbi:arylsulfatase A-like enzyme [Melghirimyces profundicolus]|uniref:Arylsulfatase A-like enzyme n=1 Tax=Melghirimyces profundicolus TaxID=1242148 RepID=A0A2T6C9G5_9BACL|nr:arylsulfatase A-like enzyme [Melghirimyces profundicolus]
MRVLYIDIDSLRPDHLGCYGYHRKTSPVMDQLAEEGARFTEVYASDAPCLPSRTALFSGRFGIKNGVVGHGGTAGNPFIQGVGRGFRDRFGEESWPALLRRAGMRTVTVSTFADRHSAWHWYAGFNEVYNHGTCGEEGAHEVVPYALRWIEDYGTEENWFLHVNLWDPHTPYRVPEDYGNPFQQEPAPTWLTEEILAEHRTGFGPHSAREPHGFGGERVDRWPRVPQEIGSLNDYKQWMDGYDTGIRYADEHIGQLLEALEKQGVLDEVLIIVSADHGESQGEMNVYGDHQLADTFTCRVPLIIKGPGVKRGVVDEALHYHLDLAPTVCEWMGVEIPQDWDGRSFASTLRSGEPKGREHLVLSQGAWACQRGVRFGDWLFLRTYHTGLKDLKPTMLFHLREDPHQTKDRAPDRPDIVGEGKARLESWLADTMVDSVKNMDPMWTVLREGGPFHTRGMLESYGRWLRETGRGEHAEYLEAHPTGLP